MAVTLFSVMEAKGLYEKQLTFLFFEISILRLHKNLGWGGQMVDSCATGWLVDWLVNWLVSWLTLIMVFS